MVLFRRCRLGQWRRAHQVDFGPRGGRRIELLQPADVSALHFRCGASAVLRGRGVLSGRSAAVARAAQWAAIQQRVA
jgi:hypothetical protein